MQLLEELLVVGLGHAEEVGDDQQRVRAGELADELAPPVGRNRSIWRSASTTHELLVLLQPLRGDQPHQQAALGGVLGWVEGGQLVAEGQPVPVGLDDPGDVVALQRAPGTWRRARWPRCSSRRWPGRGRRRWPRRTRSPCRRAWYGSWVTGHRCRRLVPVGVGILGEACRAEVVDGVDVDRRSQRAPDGFRVDYTVCSVGEWRIRAIVERRHVGHSESGATRNSALASTCPRAMGPARTVLTGHEDRSAPSVGPGCSHVAGTVAGRRRRERADSTRSSPARWRSSPGERRHRPRHRRAVRRAGARWSSPTSTPSGARSWPSLGVGRLQADRRRRRRRRPGRWSTSPSRHFGGLHVMFNNAGISSSFRRLLTTTSGTSSG